jgi:hypothetical protein
MEGSNFAAAPSFLLFQEDVIQLLIRVQLPSWAISLARDNRGYPPNRLNE